MKNKLIICRGYPGQGKTSFALKKFPNIFHIENDMFHYKNGEYCYDPTNMKDAIRWCVDMTDTALRNGMDVIVTNTFTKKIFVDNYKKIADSYEADFEVYRMMGNFKNIHEVPKFILENMKNNFEDYPEELFVYPKDDDYEILKGRKQ